MPSLQALAFAEFGARIEAVSLDAQRALQRRLVAVPAVRGMQFAFVGKLRRNRGVKPIATYRDILEQLATAVVVVAARLGEPDAPPSEGQSPLWRFLHHLPEPSGAIPVRPQRRGVGGAAHRRGAHRLPRLAPGTRQRARNRPSLHQTRREPRLRQRPGAPRLLHRTAFRNRTAGGTAPARPLPAHRPRRAAGFPARDHPQAGPRPRPRGEEPLGAAFAARRSFSPGSLAARSSASTPASSSRRRTGCARWWIASWAPTTSPTSPR